MNAANLSAPVGFFQRPRHSQRTRHVAYLSLFCGAILLLATTLEAQTVRLPAGGDEVTVVGRVFEFDRSLFGDRPPANTLPSYTDSSGVEYHGDSMQFGIGRQAIRFQTTLLRESPDDDWYLVSRASRLEYYDVALNCDSGSTVHMQAGLAQTTSSGALAGPVLAFPIDIPPGQVCSLLIVLGGNIPRHLDIVMLSDDTMRSVMIRENQKLAVFIVLDLLVGVIVTVLSVRMRSWYQVFYIGFLICYILLLLHSAHFIKPFVPDALLWINGRLGYVWGGAGISSMAVFLGLLLRMREYVPGLWKLMRLSVVLDLSITALCVFVPEYDLRWLRAFYIVNFACVVLINVGCLLVTLKGYRPALFSMIGTSGLAVCVGIFLLLGIMDNPLVQQRDYFLYAAFAFESAGIILAVASRANLDKQAAKRPRNQPQADPESDILSAELMDFLNERMSAEHLYRDMDLTLQTLAHSINVKPHALSALLNSRLNKNFNRYVNEFRVREACKLLKENPEMKILEIAYAVGFNSKSSFNAAFKTIQKCSPREYRKNIEYM
ncbi:MAG: helix-turn-helix domain-containing protein [Leptospiraceae bacterium]|nr:helix-turn-helix domain-containing protein [Leptospiraceae bacterium]